MGHDVVVQHAAAVIGRRMVVVGGQTSSGLSNDVQVFLFVNLQGLHEPGRSFRCFGRIVLSERSVMCLQMLHLSRMTWTELGRGGGFANGNAGNLKAVTPVAIPGQLPQCRGHSLVGTSPESFPTNFTRIYAAHVS